MRPRGERHAGRARVAGRSAALCLLALCLAARLDGAQTSLAHSVSRELPSGLSAGDALLRDVDGDGRADLVLDVRPSKESSAAAGAVLIHSASADGSLGSALRLDLTPDVVAWALGDVHADAGVEVVLFGAAGVFAWRPRAPESERFVRLAACDFLWQLPTSKGAFLYADGVRDVDGDGLEDLVCPEPGGWRLALQRRGGAEQSKGPFDLQHVLRVPGWPDEPVGTAGGVGSLSGSVRKQALSLNLGSPDDSGSARTLLELEESVPAPQWVDWDGDGRLDLAAQSVQRLHVWSQTAAGTFASAPSGSFALPVVADRTRRLDASYRAYAQDLDGDRRADVAIFAGDPRASDVRTQMLGFLSAGAAAPAGLRNPFGERGVPQDLLVLAGFVASAEFVDVDGDSFPELVAHTLRPDLIDQLRSAASQTIDAEMFVYRNVRGRLQRKPSFAWRYTLPLEDFEPLIDFVGDVTGDGLAEFVVRDQPGRVRLYMLRAAKDAWTLVERPLWEGGVDAAARVQTQLAPGRATRDLIALDGASVTLVHFGP